MKKSRFFGWVTAVVAFASLLLTTGCNDSNFVDKGLASLDLSTEEILFDYDGGVATFEIDANRDWEISIPSSDEGWLNLDFTSGYGGAKIVLTSSASKTSRYSDVTVRLYNAIGTIFSKKISITQGRVVDESTLAYASKEENVGETFDGLTGTVVALTSVSYVVMDDTGGILVYAGGTPPFSIGDEVEIAGTTVAYAGLSQFSSDAKVSKIGETTVDFSSPQVMSGEDLDEYISATPIVKYVKYTGTLSESGNYVNITDIAGASSARGSLAYVPTGLYDSSLNGQVVDVYGYLVGYTGGIYLSTVAICVVATGGEFVEPESSGGADSDEMPEYELTGTIAASDITAVNADENLDAIFGNYLLEWSKGTGSTTPKYYTSGDAIRMYINNTLTISTLDGSMIESIDLSLTSGNDYLVCDSGELVNGVWTGSASKVVFTSTASHSRVEAITLDGFVGDGEEGEEGEGEGEGGEGEVEPEPEPEPEVDFDSYPAKELAGMVLASDFGSTDAVDMPDMIFGNYLFIWSKGDGTNAPKYYDTGDAARLYINNTLTIMTVDGSPIESIEMSIASSYDFLSCDVGTLSSGSWTGSSNKVVFTSSKSHTRIYSFILDGFTGEVEEEEETEKEETVQPTTTFEFSMLPSTPDATDVAYTISDVDFVVKSMSYSTTYSNATLATGGYIYNTTAIDSEFVTVIVSYANANRAKLYAGTSENPTEEVTSKLTTGNVVAYKVPAGTTHIKLSQESSYSYVKSIELSNVAVDGEDPEEEVEEDVNPDNPGEVLSIGYEEILDALGKTVDDISSTAGLSLIGESVVFDGVTMTAAKSGTETNFRLWSTTSGGVVTGTTIRSYNGNLVTFTATGSEKIVAIEFNVAAISSATEGTTTTTKWVGETDEVTITMSAATMSTITVTFAAAE
ncbi:MAG: BACON domain-containing protein [Rikenellaceae bacterium]